MNLLRIKDCGRLDVERIHAFLQTTIYGTPNRGYLNNYPTDGAHNSRCSAFQINPEHQVLSDVLNDPCVHRLLKTVVSTRVEWLVCLANPATSLAIVSISLLQRRL